LLLQNAQDFPLWANILIFGIAAVIVWFTGTRLTRDVDGIAEQTGMGQAFVGMLLLGSITSLPEIANCITSAVIGAPALAVNNLLGSASINLLLLAGVDAFVGRKAATAMVAQPSTLMMAALCMLVLAAVALAIVVGDALIFGIGIAAALICALSVGAFWIVSGYEARTAWALKPQQKTKQKRANGEADAQQQSLRFLILRTVLAGALIFAAGYSLAQTGDAIATQTGIGAGMIGFVLIGTATSLPELSTITAAFRIRRYEMAFGQVLGTNFVNLALIVLIDAFFAGGPVINELGRFEIVSALLGVFLIGILLVGLLEHRDPKIMRMGYDSLAVVLVFAGGVLLLYMIR